MEAVALMKKSPINHTINHLFLTKSAFFLNFQVTEMLQRMQKMDLLLIQCLEKFEDSDRYALSLPELVERSLTRQKELVRALMDDRKKIQRLTEDKENAEKHCKRLDEEVRDYKF